MVNAGATLAADLCQTGTAIPGWDVCRPPPLGIRAHAVASIAYPEIHAIVDFMSDGNRHGFIKEQLAAGLDAEKINAACLRRLVTILKDRGVLTAHDVALVEAAGQAELGRQQTVLNTLADKLYD